MSKTSFLFGLGVIALLIISLYTAKYGARGAQEEIQILDQKIAEARQQKSLLIADLAHMSNREKIEAYARDVLGMGPATAEQFAREAELNDLLGQPVQISEAAK